MKSPLVGHGKSASVSIPNGKPTHLKGRLPASSSSAAVPSQSTSARPPSASPGNSDDLLPVPDYISPIHWPSTNPVFQLSKYEFAPATDLRGTKLRVDIWGQTNPEGQDVSYGTDTLRRSLDPSGKGKGKQLDVPTSDAAWKVLESWDVALSDLKSLPEDVSTLHRSCLRYTHTFNHLFSLLPTLLTYLSTRY